VVANVLFFGGAALLLMLVGLWGVRRAGQLSAVDGWDEASKEHRRGVLRRGGFTCVALGAIFLAITVASLFLSPAY
jgi:hypothetical protein